MLGEQGSHTARAMKKLSELACEWKPLEAEQELAERVNLPSSSSEFQEVIIHAQNFPQ